MCGIPAPEALVFTSVGSTDVKDTMMVVLGLNETNQRRGINLDNCPRF